MELSRYRSFVKMYKKLVDLCQKTVSGQLCIIIVSLVEDVEMAAQQEPFKITNSFNFIASGVISSKAHMGKM